MPPLEKVLSRTPSKPSSLLRRASHSYRYAPTSLSPSLTKQNSRYAMGEIDSDAPVEEGPGLGLQKTKSIAEKLSPFREFLFISLICCAQLTTQAGLSQCLAILHVIGESFNITDPGDLSWLIAAYSLTVGTFILVAGRFGDLFGYKPMIAIGFAWFALWSLVAGVSVYSNAVLFNFARALQG